MTTGEHYDEYIPTINDGDLADGIIIDNEAYDIRIRLHHPWHGTCEWVCDAFRRNDGIASIRTGVYNAFFTTGEKAMLDFENELRRELGDD